LNGEKVNRHDRIFGNFQNMASWRSSVVFIVLQMAEKKTESSAYSVRKVRPIIAIDGVLVHWGAERPD
jgi:hypothetical protein